MPRVQADKNYFAYAYCVNTALNVSETMSKKYGTWKMNPNSGYPVITGITFSVPLSNDLVDSTCGAFAVGTFMPCNRTICPSAKAAC